MNLYSVVLFLHVLGAICVFAGVGVLVFGTVALRWAKRVEQVRALAVPLLAGRRIGFEHISVIDVITVGGILVVAATGLYMGLGVWGWQSGWVKVAVVSFALMAPVGPVLINPRLHAIAKEADESPDGPVGDSLRKRTTDPFLGTSIQMLAGWLLGLVFPMTNRPSISASVLAMVVALASGFISSAPLWRNGQVR